jgi:hypothetical protein
MDIIGVQKNLVIGHAINIIILKPKKWVEQCKNDSRRIQKYKHTYYH